MSPKSGEEAFILIDSGNTEIHYFDSFSILPDPWTMKEYNQLDGITNQQWNWLIDTAASGNYDHAFLFQHAATVGHYDEAIDDRQGTIINHDEDIVTWVNGDYTGYGDPNIEAVFNGHVHGNRGYGGPDYEIDIGEMDIPTTVPFGEGDFPYSWSTVYIETTKCTLNDGPVE